MENIKTVEQFKRQINETVSEFQGQEAFRNNETQFAGLLDQYVTLADKLLKVVPESTARSVALSGLIQNAYVVVGIAIGHWTKAAA